MESISKEALAGFWKLDEGSGTMAHDSSAQGNDASISGAAWEVGCE